MMDDKEIKPKIDTNSDVVNQFTGEKWYYSDIVKDHFFHPRNLMLDDPKDGEYDAVGMVGSPACLSPSTLVLTNPGLKEIEQIQAGQKVLGHDSGYHTVERIFKVNYSGGGLVKIRNYLGELVATPDHLVYAKQIPAISTYKHNEYKRKIPSSWVHAGDLKAGDTCLYPLPTEIRHLDYITFASEIKKWDFKSRKLPKKIKITKDLLELFGYFIAEGSARDTEINFVFSNDEMQLAKRVKEITKNIFGLETKIKPREDKHRIDVLIYNTHLAKKFRELFGVLAKNKKIQESFLFLEPELQKSLLKGLWLGDGFFADWRRQPRAGFTTISPVLFQQVIFLLLRQRIISSTFKEKPKTRNFVNHQASYRLHVGDMDSLEKLAKIIGFKFKRNPKKRHEKRIWFEDDYVCLPVKKVLKAVHKNERLFNLEVADSHTYATDAFLVHNCGDMMKMWLKVEGGTEKVKEMKWRTFGCGSAIAATSMFSVMVTENGGVPIGEALKIRPQHIMERLGGLPNRKIHCSVLADKAFRKAANEYFRNTGQIDRIIIEGAKVIDAKLNITDKDIEEAVLEGAVDLEGVQKKLKVGIGSPDVIPEVEQLIRFYKEKYYG